MTSHWSKALWAAGLSAALTVGAALPARAQTAEIALGAIVPSSGPFAEWGRANTVTLQMLEKQVNDGGGRDVTGGMQLDPDAGPREVVAHQPDLLTKDLLGQRARTSDSEHLIGRLAEDGVQCELVGDRRGRLGAQHG